MAEEGGVGPPVRIQPGMKTQVGALMKKNMRIHLRSAACSCFKNCCTIKGAPLFSACCLHVGCPIAFAAVLTIVPYIVVISTATTQADADNFLTPRYEPGEFVGQWPWEKDKYFSCAEKDKNFYQLCPPDRLRTPEPGDEVQNALGDVPILDQLFREKSEERRGFSSSGPTCERILKSCHCQTIAIVGPSQAAQEFKTFVEAQYSSWKAKTTSIDKVELAYKKLGQDLKNDFKKRADIKTANGGRMNFGMIGGRRLHVHDIAENSSTMARRLQREEENTCADMCDVDAGHDGTLFRIFSSEEKLDEWIDSPKYGQYSKDRSGTSSMDRVCGAIIMENDVLTARKPAFTIRANVTHERGDPAERVQTWLTLKWTHPQGWGPQLLHWYLDSQFLGLQRLTHLFLAEKRAAATTGYDPLTAEPHFLVAPTSKKRVWQYGMIVTTIMLQALIMGLMFGPVTTTISYYMAKERQTRQRELLRMMGLSDSALVLSWVLMFVGLNLVITLGMNILFFAFMFLETNFLLFWFVLWFYANAVTAFGMFFAALVTSERFAAMCAFGAMMGSLNIQTQELSYGMKAMYTVLLPPVGLVPTCQTVAAWEIAGIGNGFGNSNAIIENFSVGAGIGLMFVSFWLYLALYYYVDNIAFWHNIGVARPPWFMFTGNYWREIAGRPAIIDTSARSDSFERTVSNDPDLFESENEAHLQGMITSKRCVLVDSLCKSFKNALGAQVVAVRELSLTMYQDECYCLLGHNGAGKTTTMMMLTGCLPQTSGSITMRGHSIPQDIRTIRSDMGFCPQHNVLIDELTVLEHLQLFGTIGGMSNAYILKRGTELLAAVALLDKMHARSSSLSGGMKRKLSCALAFLAEPYLVMLDEPSSGMDPFARRGMWDTLKRWRTGHILCLTTHYMDEADALGDRIGIMSDGKLACNGSSTFLKKQFGCGYVLSFAKSDEGNAIDDKILSTVQSVAGSEAAVMSAVGRELLIQVPFSAGAKFGELFPLIDSTKEALCVESYGTSVTNLEEVFLKVAKLKERGLKQRSSSRVGKEPSDSSVHDGKIEPGDEVVTPIAPHTVNENPEPFKMWALQVWALLVRRFKFASRNKVSCGCQVIGPMTCMLIACLMSLASLTLALPALVMDSSKWNEQVSGITNPISVGFASPTLKAQMQPMFENPLPPGIDKVHMDTVGSLAFPVSLNTPVLSVSRGLSQEAAFVEEMWQNAVTTEASQYGGLFYPSDSSWCPDGHTDVCQDYPGVTVVGNHTAVHALPIMYNIHASAILRSQSKNMANPVDEIVLTNKPLQMTANQVDQAVFFGGIFISFSVVLAYGCIPAAVTSFVVLEKEKDVKNQLIISGCSCTAYWLSNFIFDVLWSFIPACGVWIIFAIFDITAYIESPGIDSSVALMFMFLPAMSGFAYLCSFLFSRSGIALFVCWIGNLVFGLLAMITTLILSFFPDARDAQVALKWIFRFAPTFSLGWGHYTISLKQTAAQEAGIGALTGLGVGGAECPEIPNDRLPDDLACTFMVGDEFLILALSAPLFMLITIIVDVVIGLPKVKQLLGGKKAIPPVAADNLEDDMVLQEKARVKEVDKKTQFVYVNDIRKVYNGKVHAVRGISFAADQGQVFGLLGVNGAGKTTTFKMLCGQVEPSAGEVCVQGYDMTMNASEARKHIGYCPQFDALLDTLTTRDHLYLYGRLKGLSGVNLKNAVYNAVEELDLTNYMNSRAGQLSGGNKRKLSVAMSVIGEPPMVFLDEPSAGMDPVARRGMWSVIQNIADKRQKSVVILTTHSMEEAEALCSRVAIQVDGRFRCLGTAQQIKTKYGHGLELNVRLASPTLSELQDVALKFGGSGEMSSAEARGKVVEMFGNDTAVELASRMGSPLTMGAATGALVLAEWALLAKRTLHFEAFVASILGAEAPNQPTIEALEKSQNVLRYQVLPAVLQGKFKSLGALFKVFEDNKHEMKLEDFQLCQPSLEQIFNRFAGTQDSQVAMASQLLSQPAAAASQKAATVEATVEGTVVTPFAPEASKVGAESGE